MLGCIASITALVITSKNRTPCWRNGS